MKLIASIVLALVAAGTASADPALPRVLDAPTAWLPPAGGAIATGGLDQHGDGSIDVGYGLGGVAGLELGADTDTRECAAPPCGTENLAKPRWMARAAFRMGLRQDLWFEGQPALVVGFRKALGDTRAIGEVYFAASRVIGLVRLHAGVGAMDARHAPDLRMGAKIRPFGGVEFTPPQYPKTSLLVDIAWLPELAPQDPTTMAITDSPGWVIGEGVRYQALTWGSIELDVRHRGKGGDAEGLAATTVMVRINGVWSPK